MAALISVFTKASNRRGIPAAPTDYYVTFGKPVKGGFADITVFRDSKAGISAGTKLAVGDLAEYDSYNLSYTGKITKITEKCVTIVAYPGSTIETTHRLDLNTFCWRNWDFNAAETAARNAETSMYI
jgi:hypothetical protein